MNNTEYKTLKYIDGDVDIDVYEIEGEYYLTKKDIAALLQVTIRTIERAAKQLEEDESEIWKKATKCRISLSTKSTTFYPLNYVEKLAKNHNYEKYLKLKSWLNETKPQIIDNNTKIVRYSQDNINIDVIVSPGEKTVWLTQKQIAELFGVNVKTITIHINNIYREKELERWATGKDFLLVQTEGERTISRNIEHYNLQMILSIGYRVNGARGIAFRKWASSILTRYLNDGFVFNDSFYYPAKKEDNSFLLTKYQELSKEFEVLSLKVNSLIKQHHLFVKGRAFEAFSFLSAYVMQAKHQIIFIDPYADKFMLSILTAKRTNVSVTIIGSKESHIDEEALQLFKRECGNISFIKNNDNHDRYLIIDSNICLDIGTSINSIGYYDFHINIIDDKDFINNLLNRYLKEKEVS